MYRVHTADVGLTCSNHPFGRAIKQFTARPDIWPQELTPTHAMFLEAGGSSGDRHHSTNSKRQNSVNGVSPHPQYKHHAARPWIVTRASYIKQPFIIADEPDLLCVLRLKETLFHPGDFERSCQVALERSRASLGRKLGYAWGNVLAIGFWELLDQRPHWEPLLEFERSAMCSEIVSDNLAPKHLPGLRPAYQNRETLVHTDPDINPERITPMDFLLSVFFEIVWWREEYERYFLRIGRRVAD